MTFGERIRSERVRLGMKQQDLAEAAWLSKGYLCGIEHDRRGAPPDAVIRRIADGLGCFPDLVMVWAGRLPEHLRDTDADHETVLDALALMAITLNRGNRS